MSAGFQGSDRLMVRCLRLEWSLLRPLQSAIGTLTQRHGMPKCLSQVFRSFATKALPGDQYEATTTLHRKAEAYFTPLCECEPQLACSQARASA
jgi:hypothetical protein